MIFQKAMKVKRRRRRRGVGRLWTIFSVYTDRKSSVRSIGRYQHLFLKLIIQNWWENLGWWKWRRVRKWRCPSHEDERCVRSVQMRLGCWAVWLGWLTSTLQLDICGVMMIAFITIKSSLVPLIEGLCQDLVHLDSSGPPGVSSRLLGSHPSTSAECVCVCVYTHSHTHTLPPALKIEKTQTTPLSFLL